MRGRLRAGIKVTVAAAGVAAAGMAALWLSLASPGPAAPEDRPLAAIRADGALRVVALGTSLTARPGWPEALEQRLARCLPEGAQVIRLARAGANVAWGLQQVEAVRALAPDVVLVEFAINDADLRDGLSLSRAGTDTAALIAGLQRALPAAAVALMTTSPARGLRGWLRPRLQDHYRQYRQLAAATGAGLIDLAPRWVSVPAALRDFPDGLHPPGPAAAAVAAPPIAGMIARALGRGGC